MANSSPSSGQPATSYSTDPALYIYTSLTAGSSHIVTATSRLETILRANRIPFKAIDIATDEKARMLWGRRAGKDESGRVRKLPGLVQNGVVLGDLVEIEEWNEYGELKQHVTMYYDEFTQPSIKDKPKEVTPVKKEVSAVASAAAAAAAVKAPAAVPAPPPPPPSAPPKASSSPSSSKAGVTTTLPVRSVAEEAARKAKEMHLQSLRAKVQAAKEKKEAQTAAEGGKEPDESSKPAAAPSSELPPDDIKATTVTLPVPVATATSSEDATDSSAASRPADVAKAKIPAGLQSPTSGAWRESTAPLPATAAGSASADVLRQAMQSPTSTTWKPLSAHIAPPPGTVVDPLPTSHRGSMILTSASAEEIAAVEAAERIDEDPEAEEEAEEEEEEQEKSGTEKKSDALPMKG